MNPADDEPGQTEAARLALARHQRRREQGVPTLSVLVGETHAAITFWRAWVDSMDSVTAEIAAWTGENRAPGRPHNPAGGDGRAVLYVRPAAVGEDGHGPLLAETVARLSRFLGSAGPGPARAVLAVAVDPAAAAAYLRDEPYSRARTLFAEGMVALPDAAGPILPPPSPDEAVRAGLARSAAVLARQQVPRETADRFQEAAAARQEAASPGGGDEAADRARSAAERFLHGLLGELPDTAGLFELNVRLDFCFGPMRAEVDLLAASLGLAVELDGFHHFRDPENYRRDRRKDALLQKQGYLVLRFLAEDVVVRLEAILEEIRAAVAFRRATTR